MSEDLSNQNPPIGEDETTGDGTSAGEEKTLEYAKPGTSTPAPPFVIALPDEPTSSEDWYLWAGVLALLALVAFWPAIWGNFLFDDDRQYLDCLLSHIVEYSHLANSKPILRLAQPTQTLDAAPARLFWLMPQMCF